MPFELISVGSYFPKIYTDVLETDKLIATEDIEFEGALEGLDALWANQYIRTANEWGIERFEKVLNIHPKADESWDFRRDRLLNRFSISPPITRGFLAERLDDLVGKGKWVGKVDYASHTLQISFMATSQVWDREILVTILQMKPANMSYASLPAIFNGCIGNEGISVAKHRTLNYVLGPTCILGDKPILTGEDWSDIKMESTPSLQPPLFEFVASCTLEIIKEVLVNDSLIVSDFSLLGSEDNVVNMEYTVLASAGLGTVTNVKIISVEGEVLSNATVDIDNTFDLYISHKIIFREGL